MSIAAIVEQGVIRPLEPLPKGWTEGHQVAIVEADEEIEDAGLIAAIKEAEADLRAGRVISNEAMKARLDRLLSDDA